MTVLGVWGVALIFFIILSLNLLVIQKRLTGLLFPEIGLAPGS